MATRKKMLPDLLKRVDPNLTVIPGGIRRRSSSTERDWIDAGGATCPKCGKEALRFRPRDGVCIRCAGELDENGEREKRKQAKHLKFVKEHNARVDRMRRGGT